MSNQIVMDMRDALILNKGKSLLFKESHIEDLLSEVLGMRVSIEIDTSHDYRDYWYEGDTPDIRVDGIYIRKL